ncbi:hypothetical protein, partial [Eudoraea algarum]|uniref:hypothetical protein n=1 Tax=Eudoraea algarum TaxID=3417568 RepID=UPI003F5D4EA4
RPLSAYTAACASAKATATRGWRHADGVGVPTTNHQPPQHKDFPVHNPNLTTCYIGFPLHTFKREFW